MRRVAIVAMPLLVALPALAKPTGMRRETAPAVQALLDCRGQTDTARLACYDAAAASLASSLNREDVMVVDKAQVREARRSVFGFTLPDLGLFRSSGSDAPEDRQIAATVRTARIDGDGNWVVTLESGAVWKQTDNQTIARSPRAGDAVVITRAALGSYFMRIGKQPGVKARRES